MSNFNIGDVVELKSGSPKMTVMVVIGHSDTTHAINMVAKQQGFRDGDVSCIWFNNNEKQSSFFYAETLRLSE